MGDLAGKDQAVRAISISQKLLITGRILQATLQLQHLNKSSISM